MPSAVEDVVETGRSSSNPSLTPSEASSHFLRQTSTPLGAASIYQSRAANRYSSAKTADTSCNDWPDYGIRAEVHGIPHSEIQNWDNDLIRQNDISIEGGGLLLFSSYATRHLQSQVGDQLVRMFRRRGWPG